MDILFSCWKPTEANGNSTPSQKPASDCPSSHLFGAYPCYKSGECYSHLVFFDESI